MNTLEEQNDIRLALKELIEMKSKRDNSNFTISQLANEIGMPHSILSKLTHSDPLRRVTNPRIETIKKIVHFFRKDGFDITIDNLLKGIEHKPTINVEHQDNITVVKKHIPLFLLDSALKNSIGSVEIDLTSHSNNLIALVSDEFIEPLFKRGSVFIIDKMATPKNDNLVAVRIQDHQKILIRKYTIENNKIILKQRDNDTSPIILMPTISYCILGVVVQANIKT